MHSAAAVFHALKEVSSRTSQTLEKISADLAYLSFSMQQGEINPWIFWTSKHPFEDDLFVKWKDEWKQSNLGREVHARHAEMLSSMS